MATIKTRARQAGKATTVKLVAQILEGTTHYEVLGVPPNADTEQIKAAHRTMALLFHPDRCEREDAHDLMAKANVAYACLTDKAARKLYDMTNQKRIKPCPTCGGKGFTHKQRGFMAKQRVSCYDCGGSGQCSE